MMRCRLFQRAWVIVVLAGIPSREQCLGGVRLNAQRLFAGILGLIPEAWVCVNHAAAKG